MWNVCHTTRSIVRCCPLFPVSVLFTRILMGVVAQFEAWHAVYHLAAGMQAAVLAMMPGFPPKNTGVVCQNMLAAQLVVMEPRLQACVIVLVSSVCLANPESSSPSSSIGHSNFSTCVCECVLFLPGMRPTCSSVLHLTYAHAGYSAPRWAHLSDM